MARTLLGALLNRATATPVPFASRAASHAHGMFGSRRDAVAQMQAMSASGTLYAITNRTAKGIAQIDWHLYRTAKSGKDEDRIEVTSHAALDLWNKPNRFFTQNVFVETGAQHKLLTGEQWWVIARDERSPIPLEMWPVRPDRIRPVPDPEVFLAGYMYTGPDGQEIALRLEDVIFIRTPNPLDPYRGMGPVQSILTDLDSSRYAAEWNRNFFANSAAPGGVLEVDRRLDDAEFSELRERWNEQHKGVANAHRVAIAEGGLKWVDRTINQRDMQFVELRNVSREVIREAYGFPKPMLGSVDDVNRANADAGEVMFARWLLVPEAEAIKDALNSHLLPLFGSTAKGLEFDYDNPVPEDRELASKELQAKAVALREFVQSGVYGPEALEALDLPAMAFGQPGADPDRELLIDLVKAAPAALASTILPMLGFDVPKPPPPPSAPASEDVPPVPAEPEDSWGDAVSGLLGEDVENAMRWEVIATIDDSTCQPCADNDGHLYRNRAAAYKDYPGGSGYVNCVGAEYGNECRCKVVKRRKTGDDE